MTIAYLDCSAGISGDMFLGALVDAGVPLKKVRDTLKRLPVKGYTMEARKVQRASIAATKVDVIIGSDESEDHAPKIFRHVADIVNASSLPLHIKQRGLRIFKSLFEAEGKVHGKAYNRTHLHELGAVDCIVDIFGSLIALDYLGVDRVYASAVNLGSGSVTTDHGTLPVPAPATAELLRGIPVYASDIPFELTTPTGAAIIKELAEDFMSVPPMRINRIGYGAGQKNITGLPNALRILWGESPSKSNSKPLPFATIIETNIDDMNPQLYSYIMERLFQAGALDVYLTQVIMKKGRPGVILTVLCHDEKRTDIIDILLKETTTLGVRIQTASRVVLEREIKEVKTEFGVIRVKVSRESDGTPKITPEYEDCRRIAKKHGIPLRQVMDKLNCLTLR
ncbi:MAG: nickel pincer cofactor biosynthesis protein LarC [Thermodesulfovibrionales bacterium]